VPPPLVRAAVVFVVFLPNVGKKYRFGQKTQKLFAQLKKILYLCGKFPKNKERF
jgi:hypothetical protein